MTRYVHTGPPTYKHPLSCKPAFETLTIFGCAGCGGSLRVPMLRCSEQPKSAVSDDELKAVAREIRHLYWHIRTLRRGYQDAARHRYYRKIRTKKKRLLEYNRLTRARGK
ncbi:hypothetical protein RSPRV1_gp01 [Ralstonia phage RSS1]|uniref:Uncharacterized protein n=1 Tax=Ralstonia phage RSS1 TaxID=384360 RepID=A0JC31_9VIRU|nr:hypothetical protein RSPRV1_gp01 [Ralstonia phage RSS1]BAF36533.1 hypothetical protein [Ralstonia phage RSS1]